MKSVALVPALLVCALTACGKSETPGSDVSAEPAITAKAEVAVPDNGQRQPMPEDRPLASYVEIDSGKQLGYQYAARHEPVDYTALAKGTMWNDFRRTSDQFAQQDMIAKAMPEMEQAVAAEKANPYHWMTVGMSDNVFDAYDFQRKGFPINEFTKPGARSFRDTPSYQVKWANASQVAFAPVTDQEAAREIEAYRAGNKPFVLGLTPYPLLKIYYFVQSGTPRESEFKADTVEAWITHIQINDPTGKLLAEYKPDPSIAAAPSP